MPVFDLASNKLLKNTAALLTVLIASLYGGLIEIAQDKLFINRSGDIFDFLADLAGAIIAIIVYYLTILLLPP